MVDGPEKPIAEYRWGKGPDAYKIAGVSPEMEGLYNELGSTLKKGDVVINLGAGDGRFELNAPKQRPYTIYGIELRKEGVAGYYEQAEAVKTFADKAREALRKLKVPVGREKDHLMEGSITELPDQLTADAVVSWRVLHALKPVDQLTVCKDAYQMLPPGGSFYFAVLSDKDWKLDALRKAGVQYDGKDLVDCAPVMEFTEKTQKDFEFFFSPAGLRNLARESGFEMVGEPKVFAEASGLPQLLNHKDNVQQEDYDQGKYDRSKVKYYYVQFRKPLDKTE